MQTYLPKWELKLPKIPIIVFQIHYIVMTMENGGGGGSAEKYPKIRNKTAGTRCRKNYQKGNQNCQNPDIYPSNSLNTSKPWKAQGKNAN